ncbi:MAG: hypothetical protein KIH69_020375 [Anaerolineae bacterium]|nr:hypothetical protein [Anaerolineae bacterium]
MNNLPLQPIDDLMLMALDGNLNAQQQDELDAYLAANPEASAVFAQMMADDDAFLALPLPSLPLGLSKTIMSAIAMPEVMAPKPVQMLKRAVPQPVAQTPSWVWQLAFVLMLTSVLVAGALTVWFNLSPILRYMLIALEIGELNAFVALFHSIKSFFWGATGALFTFFRALLRQPSAWAGLALALAIVAAWVVTMVAIYRPAPSSA